MGRLSVTVAAVCCASLLGISGSFAQNLGGQANRPIESGPIDVAQLTQRADLIVHGVVSSKRTAWIGRVIYTLHDVPVQETLKGAPRSSVVVAVAGGARGNVRLRVPGAPDLQIGEQLVVFATTLQSTTFTPVGAFDGIVRVRQGGGRRHGGASWKTRVPGRLPRRSPHAGRPMMTRHSKKPMRRSSGTLLIAVGSCVAIAVGFTSSMRASDNLDFDIDGQIYDAVWDSRLFDGTPGFSGAILWFHNPSGMPGQHHPGIVRSQHRVELRHVGKRRQRAAGGTRRTCGELRRTDHCDRPVRPRWRERRRLAARVSRRHSGRHPVLGSGCADDHDDRRNRKDGDAGRQRIGDSVPWTSRGDVSGGHHHRLRDAIRQPRRVVDGGRP